MQSRVSPNCRLGSLQQVPVRSQPRQVLATRCSAVQQSSQAAPATKQSPVFKLAAAFAAAAVITTAPPPALAASFAPQLEAQVMTSMTTNELSHFARKIATIAEVATDLKFEPEKAIGGPGLSAAQDAASRANPPPFDPAVIGGTAGLLLLAFGISTGRADPQLKMNSSSGGSSGGGGGSSGPEEDDGKVAEVQGRKKQARAWIGDWQKRTKKQ